MPREDNEWGEWDPSQYEVPPRGTWFNRHLIDKHEEPNSSVSPPNQQITLTTSSEQLEGLYFPCLRDFRHWYVWARETGRHERYLENIQTLATEFKLNTPNAELDLNLSNSSIYLSDTNLHNFSQDQISYQELLKQFLKDAEAIVNDRGENEIIDDEYARRYYSLKGNYTLTYYYILDEAIVEKDSCLMAYRKAGKVAIGAKFVRQHDAAIFRQAITYAQAL